MLPGDAQAHEGAQVVPVGQAGAAGDGHLEGPDGAVLSLPPDRLLQPVGKEGPQLPFGLGIAPEENPLAGGRRHEQVGALGLLRRGQEPGVGGYAPLLGPLLLVQDPGQQQPLVSVPGKLVQQFSLVHGSPPSPYKLFVKFSISCHSVYCQRERFQL